MDEMVIRLRPESGLMTVEEITDGIVAHKQISVDTLLECVRHSLRRDTIASGLMPLNTISFAATFDGGKEVCLWHPELYADITYYNTVYKHFPLPRLVFGFSISPENRIRQCRLGVVKNERPTLNTPMYAYPFSNVSGFYLCTGNNPLPPCASLHTLTSVPHMLLAMPNNDDSFDACRNKPQLDYRALLEHVKDKEPAYYYSDILVPNHHTLQDFILQK